MQENPPETMVLGATGLRVSAVGVGTNSWGTRGEADPIARSDIRFPPGRRGHAVRHRGDLHRRFLGTVHWGVHA